MTATSSPLRTSSGNGVATITLDREKALNALDLATLEALTRVLATFHAADDVQAIVITGAGRAFCAGGDLRDLRGTGPKRGDGFRYGAGLFHQVVLAIESAPKPVIAAINGVAAGGGMSLALACDLRIMAEDTFMQVGYLGRGLSPDGGLTFSLSGLVGAKRAFELCLADDRLDAKTCQTLGLITDVAPRGKALEVALTLAGKIARGPVYATARAKQLFLESTGADLAGQMERERVLIADCADSAEGGEGIASFLDKRAPDFAGARRSGD